MILKTNDFKLGFDCVKLISNKNVKVIDSKKKNNAIKNFHKLLKKKIKGKFYL